jgi:hypothetical protein
LILGLNSCFGAPFWENDVRSVAGNLVIKEPLTNRATQLLVPPLDTGMARTFANQQDFRTGAVGMSVMTVAGCL